MTSRELVSEIERWFVERGVPHPVETHLSEFAGDVGPEHRQVLAPSSAYHFECGTHPSCAT